MDIHNHHNNDDNFDDNVENGANSTSEDNNAHAAQHDAMRDIAYEFAQDDDPLAPTSEEDSIAGQKILILQEQLDDAKDKMMRAVAEAENTRRRMMKEREDGRKYAIANFAKDLLDFSDNFRRAIDAVPAEAREANELIKNVVSGIEAMEKDLLRTFEKHGVEKIDPMDQQFDPNYHEVMFEAPIPGKSGGIIIQVIEPGYILHDRLLRPARVGVAKDDGGAPEAPTHIDTEV